MPAKETIIDTGKRAFIATIRGERQPDGSILAANGSTWIVGKRS